MAAALAGKDYFTLQQMMDIINDALKQHNILWGHLDKQWDFTYIRRLIGVEFHRLRNAHSLCFTRTSRGVVVRWRQWMTDNTWSRPILLVTALQMQDYQRARPPEVELAFTEATSTAMLSFLDKLDILLAGSVRDSTVPGVLAASKATRVGGSTASDAGATSSATKAGNKPGPGNLAASCQVDRQLDMAWLRRAVRNEELSLRDGKTIDDIIRDLLRVGLHPTTGQHGKAAGSHEFVEDIVVQLFPGADIPAQPLDTLVQVEGSVEQQQPKKPHRDLCGPGSFLLVRNSAKVPNLPFVLGVMTDTVRSLALQLVRPVLLQPISSLADSAPQALNMTRLALGTAPPTCSGGCLDKRRRPTRGRALRSWSWTSSAHGSQRIISHWQTFHVYPVTS